MEKPLTKPLSVCLDIVLMETYLETGLKKTGKNQLHLKDEAQCLRFLPSVEMTVVLEKKKGSERGRRSRPRSLHNHHLVG